MSHRSKYSYDLRKKLLLKYFECKRSIFSLLKEHGIDEGSICKWRDIYLYNRDSIMYIKTLSRKMRKRLQKNKSSKQKLYPIRAAESHKRMRMFTHIK